MGILTENFNSGLRRAVARASSRSNRLSGRATLALVVLASFLFVACSTGGQSEDAAGAPGEGRGEDAAPDFALELFGNENHPKGELVKLSQFEGQPVVLNFWYPSCPPCRLEMPELEATFQKHKGDGLEFIGVMALILDTVEEGQGFIDEFGITYAVGPDAETKIIIDYGVTSFPTTVFLDKNHRVVRNWAGVLTAEKMEELVAPLLQ